jgi:hypothetical protein
MQRTKTLGKTRDHAPQNSKLATLQSSVSTPHLSAATFSMNLGFNMLGEACITVSRRFPVEIYPL